MKNIYRDFSKQLTGWMKLPATVVYVELFKKYHGECYGNEYIIKSNRKKKNPLYAVFIKPNNKMRRYNDVQLSESVKLVDLLMVNLPLKREGISLFKTTLNCL